MPSSPPPHPSGLQVWPDNIDYEFVKWVEKDPIKHRKLLTGQKRLEYRAYLNNRNHVFETHTDKERNRLATVKWTALKYFELQKNQIWRKAETTHGQRYPARYATCNYDCSQIVCKTHETMHHACKFSHS